MSLGRGPSRFWAALHRFGVARPRMPFWRVIVEARLDRRSRRWPAHVDGAVAAVFVWARTIEEAEGLATLALAEEGLDAVTADATRYAPAARPQRTPGAVMRGDLGYLARIVGEAGASPPSRRGARA